MCSAQPAIRTWHNVPVPVRRRAPGKAGSSAAGAVLGVRSGFVLAPRWAGPRVGAPAAPWFAPLTGWGLPGLRPYTKHPGILSNAQAHCKGALPRQNWCFVWKPQPRARGRCRPGVSGTTHSLQRFAGWRTSRAASAGFAFPLDPEPDRSRSRPLRLSRGLIYPGLEGSRIGRPRNLRSFDRKAPHMTRTHSRQKSARIPTLGRAQGWSFF